MKIFSSIGSKQRLYEMFQRVNKVNLNEYILKEDIIENAFNKLKNNELTIKQTNSQVSDSQNIIEIIATDNKGGEIIFKFRLIGFEDDQEDVFIVDDAELINFVFKSETYKVNVSEEMDLLRNFNKKYANEIVDVIGNFVDFSKESIVDNALYEDAIKLIDKIPYKRGDDDKQINKTYANEKPTNPELNVELIEFEKAVNEISDDDEDVIVDDDYTTDVEDEEDPFALPPDYSGMKNPFGDEEDDDEDEDNEGEEDPEEQALFLQATENLIARNKTRNNPNYFPTRYEIEKEVEKLKKKNQPQEPEKTKDWDNKMAKGKKRVYPAWADRFLSESDSGINVEKTTTGYYNQLTPEKKKQLIRLADELLEAKIGVKKYQIPKEVYFRMVRELAMRLFRDKMSVLNEKKNDDVSLEPQDNKILQLAQDKEERGEVLRGGRGDGKSPLEFEPNQILLGLEVEREHTDDIMIAIEIVLDHLSEDPEYYTRKKDPERSAQDGAAKDVEEKQKHSLVHILDDYGNTENLSKTNTRRNGNNDRDKEITDILLGYKPKNVGDIDIFDKSKDCKW